jgi:hypothetical protein
MVSDRIRGRGLGELPLLARVKSEAQRGSDLAGEVDLHLWQVGGFAVVLLAPDMRVIAGVHEFDVAAD